jgi:hypothetical protein
MIHDLSAQSEKHEGGVQIKLYSKFPFPVRKSRVLDAFQSRAWDELVKNPDKVVVVQRRLAAWCRTSRCRTPVQA